MLCMYVESLRGLTKITVNFTWFSKSASIRYWIKLFVIVETIVHKLGRFKRRRKETIEGKVSRARIC